MAILAENAAKSMKAWMETLTQDERKEKFGLPGEQNGFYGKKHSNDTIIHLQQKQKELRQTNRKVCEHCGRDFDAPNYARYHGEKCKNKS